MRAQPGSLYKVGDRRYVDSQALYNLALADEVAPQANGWRVRGDGGAVHFTPVEGRAALPRQAGGLYELHVEGRVSLKAECGFWVAHGLMAAAGTFETWPGEPAKAGCSSCGSSCGCAPCRQKHAHHDHDHGDAG
jgi:hypothetical protein